METSKVEKLVTVNRVVNAIIAVAVALVIANVAWGLDTQDITIEWTEAGKKIAAERVANWKAKDDMVLVPAGEFVMGSDKKTDRPGLSELDPTAARLSGRFRDRQVRSDGAGVSQVCARDEPLAAGGLAV